MEGKDEEPYACESQDCPLNDPPPINLQTYMCIPGPEEFVNLRGLLVRSSK